MGCFLGTPIAKGEAPTPGHRNVRLSSTVVVHSADPSPLEVGLPDELPKQVNSCSASLTLECHIPYVQAVAGESSEEEGKSEQMAIKQKVSFSVIPTPPGLAVSRSTTQSNPMKTEEESQHNFCKAFSSLYGVNYFPSGNVPPVGGNSTYVGESTRDDWHLAVALGLRRHSCNSGGPQSTMGASGCVFQRSRRVSVVEKMASGSGSISDIRPSVLSIAQAIDKAKRTGKLGSCSAYITWHLKSPTCTDEFVQKEVFLRFVLRWCAQASPSSKSSREDPEPETASAEVNGEIVDVGFSLVQSAILPELRRLSLLGHPKMQTIYVPKFIPSRRRRGKVGSHSRWQVHNSRIKPDRILFVGEYFPGGSLEGMQLNSLDVLHLVDDVIRVLQYSSAHQVFHGHITPPNIFRRERGFVLADFGMKSFFLGMTPLQQFTMRYRCSSMFPPELLAKDETKALRELSIDPLRADIWGLGVVAYMVYYGKEPFSCNFSAKEKDGADEVEPEAHQKFQRLRDAVLSETIEFGLPSNVSSSQTSPEGLAQHELVVNMLQRLLDKNPETRGSIVDIIRKISTHTRSLPHSTPASEFSKDALHSQGLRSPQGTGQEFPSNPKSNPDMANTSTTARAHSGMLCRTCQKRFHINVFYLCKVCEFAECASCYQSHEGPPHPHLLQLMVVKREEDSGAQLTPPPLQSNFNSSASFGFVSHNNPVSTTPLANLACRTLLRQLTVFDAEILTERELNILSTTGELPPGLEFARAMRQKAALDSNLEATVPDSAMNKSSEISPRLEEEPLATEPPSSEEDVELLFDTSQPKTRCPRKLMSEDELAEVCDSAEVLIANAAEVFSVELILSNLHLAHVPDNLTHPPLVQLLVLDLAKNQLTSIPDEIEYLVNLEELLLGENRLSKLPDSIGSLTALVILDVNHNRLTSLPQSLMFCGGLQTLALDYNSFPEIPSVLADAPVPTVYLAGNPIMHFPKGEVLDNMESNFWLDNAPTLTSEADAVLRRSKIVVTWNKVYPDKILDNLYLGSLRTTQSQVVYKTLHIQRLLTMGRGLEAIVPEGGIQKVVVVDDIDGANIDFAFEAAVGFIEEGLQKAEGCLVHCFAGMSRSATTVIAFLMMRRGMRLDEAYRLTKRGRSVIYPNDGFFQQLMLLDAKLFPGQRSLDMSSMERGKIPL